MRRLAWLAAGPSGAHCRDRWCGRNGCDAPRACLLAIAMSYALPTYLSNRRPSILSPASGCTASSPCLHVLFLLQIWHSLGY